MNPCKIAIVEDHPLFTQGLQTAIHRHRGFKVIFTALNGKHFFEQLQTNPIPDIVIMDIEMQPMNGFDTTMELGKRHPEVKVLAMTAFEKEHDIFKMISVGARGYCLKRDAADNFGEALTCLRDKGYYFSELALGILSNPSYNSEYITKKKEASLSERENEFLRLACSDYTYKEIAAAMGVAERTVEDYRDHTFRKLKVKSRQGLVLHALTYGLIRFK